MVIGRVPYNLEEYMSIDSATVRAAWVGSTKNGERVQMCGGNTMHFLGFQ